MKYQLRNFENNFQMVSSLGWIFILVSIIFIVTKGMIGFLLFTAVGVLLVWWQQRGGRISVDTAAKTIKNGSLAHSIKQPTKVFMNKQRYSQNVNSRVSSTNVKSYFYKAYLEDGEEKVLLSSNKSEERDLQKLQAIAMDLNIPFERNY